MRSVFIRQKNSDKHIFPDVLIHFFIILFFEILDSCSNISLVISITIDNN